MKIYDTANKLAQEIKESEEYKEYKNIKLEIESNIQLKEKIDKFERSRFELQLANIKGQNENDNKTLENVQKLYLELIQDPLAKKYFDAEVKFNIMLSDVNKIIAESVQDVLKK